MAGPYVFPRNVKTHAALLDSIQKRREEEERRRSPQTESEADMFGTTLAPAWQANQMIARQGLAPEGLIPETQQAQQPQQFPGHGPDVSTQPIEEPVPEPRRARRANIYRTEAGQEQDALLLDRDGTVTSYKVDPLGNEIMITTPTASDITSPTMHLFPEQMNALDTVPGYVDQLIEQFPNHTVTERPEVPRPGGKETLGFMGTVAMQSWDVAEGFVFEPIAQTVVELLPGTEGGSWDPREGFGLSILEKGYRIDQALFATTEKFRARPMWQQMVFGAVFDPSTLFAGLGLLKLVRGGTKLTQAVVRKALKESDPTASDAALDNGSAYIMRQYNEAGAGSAEPPGGWGPLKADGSEYTPQEILRMGGLDIDPDAPLPHVSRVSEIDYQEAWDAGIQRIKAESDARLVVDEPKLREVLDKIITESDPDMQRRVVDQLTESTDWQVRDYVWRRFIRTTLHALDNAQNAEGAIAGAGRVSPYDRATIDALRREEEALRIAKPEGGELTAPPKGLDTEAARFPDPTVSVGPGAPVSGTGAQRRPIWGDTEDEFLAGQVLDAFGPDEIVEGPLSILKPSKISRAYEEGQAMGLDKFAAGNAASSRAQKNMLRMLNDFVKEDIKRINVEIVEDFRKRGIPASDPRVKAALVKRGDPGFAKIKRMPTEFNFELQAALSSGAPGAAVNHARVPLRAVKDIVVKAKSDAGKRLNIENVNLYLNWRHGMDVIKVKTHAARARQEGVVALSEEKNRIPITNPASPTRPGSVYSTGRQTHGKNDWNDLANRLQAMKDMLSQHTVTTTDASGRRIISNQWEEVVKASDVVTDHYRQLLELQVAEGMVSKELATELRKNYKYYNPIKYVEGTLLNVKNIHNDGNRALIKGVARNDIRVLAEQGIDADFVRPLEMIGNYTMRTYLSVFRNRAIKALIPTLVFDPRNAGRVRHVVDDIGDLTTQAQLRPGPVAKDMTRVGRMMNGKVEVWDIPKEYEGVVDSLVSFDQNMAERTLRWVNKTPRSLLTAHNPVFFTYNFVHDMLAAFIVEGVMPHAVGMDLLRNLKAVFRGSDAFMDEWARAGGLVGGFAGQTTEDLAKVSMRGAPDSALRQAIGGSVPGVKGRGYMDAIEQLQRADAGDVSRSRERVSRFRRSDAEGPGGERIPGKGPWRWTKKSVADPMFREEFSTYRKWRKWATSPIKLVGDIAEAVEQAPRRTVATKARRQGATWEEAALRSRRVTVDFQRRGKAVGLMDAAFLYTNAAIQGFMLPIRAAKMGHAQRLRMAGLSGVAAGLYMWNTQEEYGEAFDEMSAIDKYTKLNVILGHKFDLYGHKIPISAAVSPLIREFAAFTAPVTYVMQKLRGRSEQAHWGQMVRAMMPTLNPASHLMNFGGRDASFGWQGLPMPTAIGNIIQEIATNHDSFRNEPIVSDTMLMNRDKSQHYDAFTSRVARQAGGFFDVSPKLMDHWMRVGALRDIVYGVDQLTRLFSPEHIDPQLEAIASDFESWLDISVPSDEELIRAGSTETTPDLREAEWISKNNKRVLNEFLQQHPGLEVRSDERIELERHLVKKFAEDRSYSPDGAPIFFVTNMIGKFIRTQGGNKGRLGQMKATEELRKAGYDIDIKQTREVAGKLNTLMNTLHDQQLLRDGNLWGGQRPDGDTIPKGEGYLDGQQWIAQHKDKGKQYAGAMFVYAGEMYKAAQLQGVDAKKLYGDEYVDMAEYVRDPQVWQNYKKIVATGAGAWPDVRSIGSHLASGYRGIRMQHDINGIPDYSQFFADRDDYEAMVMERDWGKLSGEEVWTQVQSELTATMSNSELEWYQDMQHIRTYWDIGRNMIASLPPGLYQDTWVDYLDASPLGRDAMTLDPVQGAIITEVQKAVDLERLTHRTTHPEMDAVYIKWGYASEPLTAAGLEMKMWLLGNVGEYGSK
jgi:hypothetical protein